MGLLQQLYINSSAFATATAVFTDQALTTLAPDGFYSMDGLVREQSSGVLGQTAQCVECAPLCGSDIINIYNNPGVYVYEPYISDDAGAVRIHVNTQGGAAGFKVDYAGTNYHAIATKNLGVLETPNSTSHTVIGDDGVFNTTGVSIPNYTFSQGDWVTGANGSYIPSNSTDFTNATYHGGGVITFPKLSATNNTCEVTIYCPFPDTTVNIQVECATLLPAFNSSQAPEVNVSDGCDATATGLFFVSLINGTAPSFGSDLATVAEGDVVYNDAYGITPVNDGWYKIDQGAMEVTDGVITDISDCGL